MHVFEAIERMSACVHAAFRPARDMPETIRRLVEETDGIVAESEKNQKVTARILNQSPLVSSVEDLFEGRGE